MPMGPPRRRVPSCRGNGKRDRMIREIVKVSTGTASTVGQPPADFVIQDAAVHGVRGLVALYGIESPGLTSSLAIAEEVAAMLD